jgi:hypothetical protein
MIAALLVACGCGSDETAVAPPAEPQLQMSLRAESRSGQGVFIEAIVRHLGGPDVFYPAGCTASCYPLMYPSISIDVVDPDGHSLFLEEPCIPPLYCPPFRLPLHSGKMLVRQVMLGDHTWQQTGYVGGTQCGQCTEVPLATGTYHVMATLDYTLQSDSTSSSSIQATADFIWD